MTAKKQSVATIDEAVKAMISANVKPSVKAKVVSHSRDYLTLEFIGNEPKAFIAGEVVEISKA